MQIEVGKCYVDRKGRIVGPMMATTHGTYPLFGECDNDTGWYANGKRRQGADMPSDLVAEYVEPVSPSEVSGKESAVEYDLSGIPTGYEFVGIRSPKSNEEFVSRNGAVAIAVNDFRGGDVFPIVKPITPPEPKQRTVAIHKWLVADKTGKECIRLGTAEWVNGCKFENVVDLGLYEEVKVNV